MKEGIYPALITPFDAQEELNEQVLGDIVEALIKGGVTGFYVGGSTGEYLLMSVKERKRLLDCVLECAAGRLDVIAHIGCQRTRDGVELARHAAEAGVTAISSLPPIYYKYTLAELVNYYMELTSAASIPLILYNAPALAGFAFDAQNVAPLFVNPGIIGIKYTAYDLFAMQRMLSKYPGKVVINGHDELFLNTLVLGVKHAIGSTFNFMAGKFIKIKRLFDAQDLAGAYALQNDANAIIEALMKVGVFRGVKGIMELQGTPVGPCRRPFSPLTKEEYRTLEGVIDLVDRDNFKFGLKEGP